jgi:replicative DNA helicase
MTTPLRISATMFVTWRRCPAQARARLDGHYQPDTIDSFRGLLAHRIFARHLTQGSLSPTTFAQTCRAEIGSSNLNWKVSQLGLKPAEIREVIADVATLYQRFTQLGHHHQVYTGTELHVEAQLEGEVTLIGTIDTATTSGTLIDWKGLSVETLLPTPDGWTTMGTVRVGDQLLDATGLPCRVTAKSELHDDRPCYRITFDDATTIVADNEHLWQVTAGDRRRNLTTVMSTEALYDSTSRGGRWFIPNALPLNLPDVILPIDPYVLGCWLGDGSARDGEITGIDDDLFDLIGAAGYAVGADTSTSRTPTRTIYGLRTGLRTEGLLNNKHIPHRYLRGSAHQRLALLQGLMDTDGTWNRRRGQAVFEVTNERLARGVYELVVSLGARASFWSGVARGFEVTTTRYRVAFRPVGFNPFRLNRKATLVVNGGARSSGRTIRRITAVGTVPTQCVAVDSPDSLYLAGAQMIPTHNTGELGDAEAQLDFYALVWSLSGQQPGATGVRAVSVGTGEVYDAAVTNDRLGATTAEVAALITDLRGADRVYRPGPYCWRCPIVEGCEAGTRALTLLTS